MLTDKRIKNNEEYTARQALLLAPVGYRKYSVLVKRLQKDNDQLSAALELQTIQVRFLKKALLGEARMSVGHPEHHPSIAKFIDESLKYLSKPTLSS